jgi:hypothetical protein
MNTATPVAMPSATPTDTASGTRWISLRDLAEARGISLHSATRLVRRNGWRRQRDNRGHVLALVPIEALSRQSDMPSTMVEGRPSAGGAEAHGDVTHLVGALEAAITAAGERAQADAATIATLQAHLAAERDRTAAEQSRADAAEAARDAAIALADQTVALLKDAAARADRAEAGRDGERARADVLRDRIDAMQVAAAALQAQLATAEAEGDALTVETAELTAQVKAAKAEAREAQAAAETLRQTDAARRGRGRLARLMAAWGGE